MSRKYERIAYNVGVGVVGTVICLVIAAFAVAFIYTLVTSRAYP